MRKLLLTFSFLAFYTITANCQPLFKIVRHEIVDSTTFGKEVHGFLFIKNIGNSPFAGIVHIWGEINSDTTYILKDTGTIAKPINLKTNDSIRVRYPLLINNKFVNGNNIVVVWPTGTTMSGDTIHSLDTVTKVIKIGKTTGIFKNKQLDQVSIYPNPTSGMIYIAGENRGMIKVVTIYDLQGRKLFVSNANKNYDLGNLTPGNYLLKVEYSNGSIYKQIISKE